MITRYRNFEDMVQAAQNAVDSWCRHKSDEISEKEKDWLQKILNILKEKKYVTIQDNEGILRDIQKIAYTHAYLSFFDVCNHMRHFNIDIEPLETEELKNPFLYR